MVFFYVAKLLDKGREGETFNKRKSSKAGESIISRSSREMVNVAIMQVARRFSYEK